MKFYTWNLGKVDYERLLIWQFLLRLGKSWAKIIDMMNVMLKEILRRRLQMDENVSRKEKKMWMTIHEKIWSSTDEIFNNFSRNYQITNVMHDFSSVSAHLIKKSFEQKFECTNSLEQKVSVQINDNNKNFKNSILWKKSCVTACTLFLYIRQIKSIFLVSNYLKNLLTFPISLIKKKVV